MKPATEALAFRVWAFCRECEWNTTAGEIAEALGESDSRIGVVLRVKGWAQRLRVGARAAHRSATYAAGMTVDPNERRSILRGMMGQTDVLSFVGDEA